MSLDLAQVEGRLAQLGVTFITARRSQRGIWIVFGFDRDDLEIIAGTSRAGMVAALVAAIDSAPRGYQEPQPPPPPSAADDLQKGGWPGPLPPKGDPT
jgi:hypothetical protein